MIGNVVLACVVMARGVMAYDRCLDTRLPPMSCFMFSCPANETKLSFARVHVMACTVTAYLGIAYMVMAYMVMAYMVMAYMVMAYMVMAYMVMAYMVMASMVMAYMVMAYMVMAYIVMAYIRALSYGLPPYHD